MLEKAFVLAIALSGASARWGHWGGGFSDSSSVKPPNCNCSGDIDEFMENGLNNPMVQAWIPPGLTEAEVRVLALRRMQLCGTDGKTYANRCEYVNNASSDPKLGIRCNGPCPCEDNESESPFMANMMSTKPRHLFPLCMNNGKTVFGFSAALEAKNADKSIGLRCWGTCDECQNDLRCPRAIGRRRDGRCRRVANQTAPNCDTCTEPSAEFLSTPWGKKMQERRMVCGSNNVTYPNKCAFLNAKANDPALGKRCRGQCPCKFDVDDNNDNEDRWKPWRRRRSWRRRGSSNGKKLCMSNKMTVSGWDTAIELMKENNNLGVRCRGSCDECATKPMYCPFDWVKWMQEQESKRPKPPNCTCPQMAYGFPKTHGHKVCGNNNQTYENICELINAQVNDEKLGFRCLGECPCRNRTYAVDMENHDDDMMDGRTGREMEDDDDKDEGRSPAGPDMPKPEESPESKDDDDNDDDDDDDDDDKNDDNRKGDMQMDALAVEIKASWRRRPRPHPRPRPGPWRRMPFCLTNGETVRGLRRVAHAFRNDSTVGIRCRGRCEWCAKHPRCPRFPPAEEMIKIRTKNYLTARVYSDTWLSMTIESPTKPPQCDCADYAQANKDFGSKFFKTPICGTDNVTYTDYCQFVNQQHVQPGLGSRCMEKCPCSQDAFKADEDDDISDKVNRLIDESGQFNDSTTKFIFCLTNGKEITRSRDLKAALQTDPGVGVRCMNHCNACRIECPRLPFPKLADPFSKGMPGMRRPWKKHGMFGEKFHGGFDDKFGGFGKFGGRFDDFKNRKDKDSSDGFCPVQEYNKARDFGYGWRWMKRSFKDLPNTICEPK